MNTQRIIFLICTIFAISAFAQTLAFPDAEGFGRFAKGGRGGDVYHVTNLKDSGPGSLRNGISEAKGPRTIVFDVSGNIFLESDLVFNKSYMTIAGQTAPGEGITLAKGAVKVQADHLIVRYIRCRLGDLSGDDADAISVTTGSNIMLDHLTASWSIDETFSCQSETVDSLTVQWCLVSESLNSSHHEKGEHGYGGIIGAVSQTFHHNLYAHHNSRSPKVTWRQHTLVDFRNNVIYNWGKNNCYDGTASYMNWANNYYKPGPATEAKVKNQIFELSDEDRGDFKDYETSLYVDGNFFVGSPSVTQDNWNGGITFKDGATEAKNRKKTPHECPAIKEQTAEVAYPLVLASAGASLVRDVIDKRIVDEVSTGNTVYKGSKTGISGLIDSQEDVGGWPNLVKEIRDSGFDKDKDGMADEWEIKKGLNPNDPEDRNGDLDNDGYTNLEEYLNNPSLDPVTIDEPKKAVAFASKMGIVPNVNENRIHFKMQGAKSNFSLTVYNAMGKKMWSYEGVKREGTKEVVWDYSGNKIGSGVYFVKFDTPKEKAFQNFTIGK